MPSYLEQLTLRLARGVERLPEALLVGQGDFLVARQQPDGGFTGREGPSDLYYTSFALRSLAVLGRLSGDVAQRAAEFLRSRLGGQTPVVDFLSLVYAAALLDSAAGIDVFAGQRGDWRQRLDGALEPLRRDDGGYAKTAEGQASGVYHSFLVLLCREVLELPLPEPERLARFVLAQRREDGGFVEISPMRRSGTNPTAAAIGILRILGALDEATAQAAVDFLLDMQTDEGGLRANTRIPIADLLSTFTGLLTLADLGAADEVDRRAVRRYAESLQLPEGGFHGAVWDGGVDVEYTFYGLGTLALCCED